MADKKKTTLKDYFNSWVNDFESMAMSKEGAWVGGALIGSLALTGFSLLVPVAMLAATEPGREFCKAAADTAIDALPDKTKQKLLPSSKDQRPK